MPKKTYEEFIAVFLATKEKALRNYYKSKAKKKYPKQFKESDFPRKPTEGVITYNDLINMFKGAEKTDKCKYRYRAKTKYADQFRIEDFQ